MFLDKISKIFLLLFVLIINWFINCNSLHSYVSVGVFAGAGDECKDVQFLPADSGK